jgi:plastocyanin
MSTHTIGKTGLALAVGTLLLAAAPAARAQQGVTVQLFQFKPGQIEVKAGTRLTWTNQDDITHTLTSGTPEQRDGRFELPLEGKGATATVELERPGVYPYFCSRHLSMRGEIRVK